MNNQNQNIDTNETRFTMRGRRDDQRRLRSTVAEFVDLMTGRVTRNIVYYDYYVLPEHRCSPNCYECVFNANISTKQDIGESFDEMTTKNNGELPIDWFERIPKCKQNYLIDMMNDKSEEEIAKRYYRIRMKELRENGFCHAECDTDLE